MGRIKDVGWSVVTKVVGTAAGILWGPPLARWAAIHLPGVEARLVAVRDLVAAHSTIAGAIALAPVLILPLAGVFRSDWQQLRYFLDLVLLPVTLMTCAVSLIEGDPAWQASVMLAIFVTVRWRAGRWMAEERRREERMRNPIARPLNRRPVPAMSDGFYQQAAHARRLAEGRPDVEGERATTAARSARRAVSSL